MPPWKPEEKWKGKDVFIIGGGLSLEKFDWNLLTNELTIGCNTAFALGESVCKICIFGDYKWFKIFENELALYKGIVFTSNPKLYKSKLPWLWTMMRIGKGLSHKALGHNLNTGSDAINLALILGAKRVFLLCFDMHLSKEGRPNWHKRTITPPNAKAYVKFIKGFESVAADLKEKFPDRQIINITDDSSLNMFPKIGCKKFWEERKKSSI